MTTRRRFLKILGSSGVFLVAGATGFALTRTPGAALAPWAQAGHHDDPRIAALSYGLLAPNPHNRQPWALDLSSAGEALLYCDLTRRLPATDPYDRQITIGLGCFLELTRMAATTLGYRLDTEPFPDGMTTEPQRLDTRPVARLRFRKEQTGEESLFAYVRERRSTKKAFDASRSVPGRALASLRASAHFPFTVKTAKDIETVSFLRDLTWEAHKTEIFTPAAYQESLDLMRFGKAEVNANPDGIDIQGPSMEALHRLGLLTRTQLADPNSTGFRQGLAMYKAMMESAMAYIWLETPGNTRLEQLASGYAWVRINLQAAASGLAVHPLSQALQEYPEMAAHFRTIHQELSSGTVPARIQMLGRLGYASFVGPSPRWPVETRILSR